MTASCVIINLIVYDDDVIATKHISIQSSIIILTLSKSPAFIEADVNDRPRHEPRIGPLVLELDIRGPENLTDLVLRHAGLKLIEPHKIKWRPIEVPHQPGDGDDAEN